jgi:CheY-like chemotaxis protein
MKARILLVEDNGIEARDYADTLRECGYDVVVAADSNQAAIEAASNPDLILMDIQLGVGPDGINTAQMLQLRGCDVPIVYLTAHSDPETLQRAEATKPYGYVVKSARDAILRITVENALARHQAEIENVRTQRMDVLGRLAAGMVHDFNNVLTPILMSCSLLRDRDLEAAARKRLIDTIETSATRSEAIISEVITFLNREEAGPRLFDIKNLFRAIEALAKEALPRNITIANHISPDLWPLWGNPTQLNRMFTDVCFGARAFMPNGGTLAFTAENVELSPGYIETMKLSLAQGNYVLVKLICTAKSNSFQDQTVVLDRIPNRNDGDKEYGLDLARARRIVEDHRGAIDFTRPSAEGRAFGIYLPAETRPKPAPAEVHHPELPQGNNELVLVVDDEASLLETVVATLESYAYRAASARDGREALLAYGKHKDEVAAIVMDLVMPNMDGMAAIQALRRANVQIPIIATSPGLKPTANEFEPFLPKPYTAAELLRTLQLVLKGRPALPGLTEASPSEWTHQMERQYWELSRLEVLQTISAEQSAQLDSLTKTRREVVYPRSVQEIAGEKQQQEALRQLLNALDRYIRAHESSN